MVAKERTEDLEYLTIQAAQHHRATAHLHAAEADTTSNDGQRTRLAHEAADAAALADLLDARTAELRQVDDARARWYAHTAATRATADCGQLELGQRRAREDAAGDTTTANRWLNHTDHAGAEPRTVQQRTESHAAQREADDVDRAGDRDRQTVQSAGRTLDDHIQRGDRSRRTEERTAGGGAQQLDADQRAAEHQPGARTRDEVARRDGHARSDDGNNHRWDIITDEHDLAEVAEQREADRRAVDDRPHPDAAEAAPRDLREEAADEDRPDREHEVRVPTAEETADAVHRAQRALAEIDRREAAERQRDTEERRLVQLARWHDDGRSAREYTRADTDDRAAGRG